MTFQKLLECTFLFAPRGQCKERRLVGYRGRNTKSKANATQRNPPHTRHERQAKIFQGNQLRRDLNIVVGSGKNWRIPSFMPVLLRYVSGPVLAIIFSFAFPEFHTLRYDPMMIAGFILSILGMVAVLLGFVMPRYYDAFIPVDRRGEGTKETVLDQPMEKIDAVSVVTAEGDGGESGSAREK